jgi:hypothetical protein
MSYIININVTEITEDVVINITPNVNEVNITRSSGSGGGVVDSVNGKIGVVVLNKTDIGLSNVENTSDLNKPVSTAAQTILNKKMEWLVKDTTPTTAVTGTISRTQIGSSILIPANTFSAEDLMNLDSFAVEKTADLGTCQIRLYHNTSNTLTGATSIAVFSMVNASVSAKMIRTFEITGGLLNGRISGNINAVTDVGASSSATLSIPFDTTIDNYFFTTAQLGNALDSFTRKQLLISK